MLNNLQMSFYLKTGYLIEDIAACLFPTPVKKADNDQINSLIISVNTVAWGGDVRRRRRRRKKKLLTVALRNTLEISLITVCTREH